MGVGKPKDFEEKRKKEENREAPKIAKSMNIIRIAEVNIEGDKKILRALLKIKGIGHAMAKAIVTASGIEPNMRIGVLTEEQIEKLETIIKNPENFGVPSFMFNRIKDPATGADRHLVSSELAFTKKSDIDFMKRIRCYKGVRHEFGLPVRGQRTRSSFRTGAVAGVAKGAARAAMREAAKAQAGAVPAPAPAVPAKPGEKATPVAPAEKKEEKK